MIKSTITRIHINAGYADTRYTRPHSSLNSSTFVVLSTSRSRRRPRIRQSFVSQKDSLLPERCSWYRSSQLFLPSNIDNRSRQIRLLSSSILSFRDFVTEESNVNCREVIQDDTGIQPTSDTELNSLSTRSSLTETTLLVNGSVSATVECVSLNSKTNEMLFFDDTNAHNVQTTILAPSISSDDDFEIDSHNSDVSAISTPLSIPKQQSTGVLENIDFTEVNDEYTFGHDADVLLEEQQQQRQQPDDDNAVPNASNFSLPQSPAETEEEFIATKKAILPPTRHPLISRLIKCIHDENVQAAINTFTKILHINSQIGAPTIEVQPGLTKAFIFLMKMDHPFEVYRVVKYYVALETSHEKTFFNGDINAYKKFYRICCDSIRSIDPRVHSTKEAAMLVRAIIRDILQLDQSGQEMCVPVLLSAICEQPMIKIGREFSGVVYRYMLEHEISVPDGYWIHMLSLSTYNRQKDIPYDDILCRVLELGLRPDPGLVLNVLENFFPFSDINAVTKVLKVLLTLQKQVAAEIKAGKTGDNKQYFVDIHLLETVGATAASLGQSEICLLVWDMLDVLEYQPSEGIYENTVVAFAMNTFTYREAFTVLYEMETRGYIPSRALIRSISIHVRDRSKNMDFAQMQVSQLRQENNIPITTSIMNVLMSGAAERGDIDRLLSILQDFDRYGMTFNADSISFGFESLGKNLMRRKKYNNMFLDHTRASTRDHIDACMVVANVLLNHMDDHQVKTTDHIIRNYVEFLCIAGHIDTATSIVLEAVNERGLVSSKSIYRVAMANAKSFRFDIARQVASSDPSMPPLGFLIEAIDREENLFNVSLMKQHDEKESTSTATSIPEAFDPLPKVATTSKQHGRNDYDRRNIATQPPSFWKPQSSS